MPGFNFFYFISIILYPILLTFPHIFRAPHILWGDPDIHGDVYRGAREFRWSYAHMDNIFKVYVYRDGDKILYNRTVVGMHGSEWYFFKNVRKSLFRTKIPVIADVLFIPFPCHRMMKQEIRWCNTGPGKYPLMKDYPSKARVFYIPTSCHRMHDENAMSFYKKMVLALSRYKEDEFLNYPSHNSSMDITNPALVLCHEINAKATEEFPLLSKNSIRVVCSVAYNRGLSPYKDISLPAVMSPSDEHFRRNATDKTILGYWEGYCYDDITEMLAKLWEADKELDIQCTEDYPNGRPEKFHAAQFCICPGDTSDNLKCITTAIHYGCVPVMLGDYYDLPFHSVLNWNKFSLFLEERDVYHLKSILRHKAGEEFRQLHKNLIKVQRHFQWNTPPVVFDAFHMVLHDLKLEAERCMTKSVKELRRRP